MHLLCYTHFIAHHTVVIPETLSGTGRSKLAHTCAATSTSIKGC